MLYKVLIYVGCAGLALAMPAFAQSNTARKMPMIEASILSVETDAASDNEGSTSMNQALSAPAVNALAISKVDPSKSFNNASRTGGLLEAHNAVRVAEGLEPLKWSYTLQAYAQEWADELANTKNCRTYHRPYSGKFGQKHGENLFEASPIRSNRAPDKLKKISAQWVVDVWMSEEPDYDHYTGDCAPGKACGHYTQIMWEETTKVGCARVQCNSLKQAWVCNYDPRGNLPGELAY